MPFNDNEFSAFLGRPIEFYRFESPELNAYYNPGKKVRTFQSIDYLPLYIKRTEAKQDKDKVTDTEITLTVPIDTDVAQLFKVITPSRVMNLTIYQKHLQDDDSESKISFLGRVRGCTFRNDFAELKCEPIGVAVKRGGLRYSYSTSCNHYLYGPGCEVDRDSFKLEGAVTAINGAQVTVAEFASQPDQWLRLGFLEINNYFYTILDHQGDTVTLMAPVEGVSGDVSAIAYAGCKRSFSDCRNKFGNELNYGGFPWSVNSNIFQKGLG